MGLWGQTTESVQFPETEWSQLYKIEISGENLSIDHVAAVTREKVRVELSQDPEVRQRIISSRKILEEKLERGEPSWPLSCGLYRKLPLDPAERARCTRMV